MTSKTALEGLQKVKTKHAGQRQLLTPGEMKEFRKTLETVVPRRALRAFAISRGLEEPETSRSRYPHRCYNVANNRLYYRVQLNHFAVVTIGPKGKALTVGNGTREGSIRINLTPKTNEANYELARTPPA